MTEMDFASGRRIDVHFLVSFTRFRLRSTGCEARELHYLQLGGHRSLNMSEVKDQGRKERNF